MSKGIPHIQKYMTVIPETITVDQTISQANDIMTAKEIRHLPVMKGDKVYGILTRNDIRTVLAFAGTDPTQVKVGDICEDNPFEVKPSAQIDDVAEIMAEKKIGSALVMDNNHLVGIFTLVDALKALVDMARQRHH